MQGNGYNFCGTQHTSTKTDWFINYIANIIQSNNCWRIELLAANLCPFLKKVIATMFIFIVSYSVSLRLNALTEKSGLCKILAYRLKAKDSYYV